MVLRRLLREPYRHRAVRRRHVDGMGDLLEETRAASCTSSVCQCGCIAFATDTCRPGFSTISSPVRYAHQAPSAVSSISS